MPERISMVLPELNPEVRQSNEKKKTGLFAAGFEHIGSTKNGSFTRNWDLHDFRDQIDYLKAGEDVDFYFRVILQDPNLRDTFVKKLNVSVDDFWETTYLREEHPEITKDEYLEKHFWKRLALDCSISGIIKKLPDDFLLETLQVYNREITRIRAESLEKIDQMRQDFMPNFKDFTKRHELEVDWPEIENKFETVSYDLFDQYYQDKHNEEKIGDYDRHSHMVRIGISASSQVPFGALQHEHLHAISGRKNIMSLVAHLNGQIRTEHNVPRLGAKFSDRPGSLPDRFSWLNEALTEDINIDIKKKVLPQNEYFTVDDGYPNERELFELVLTSGKQPIPKRLFYQAYFESDKENSADLKHREELYKAISQAYGSPRFLVELDDLVEKIGISEATEVFKSAGQAGVHDWWLKDFVHKGE